MPKLINRAKMHKNKMGNDKYEKLKEQIIDAALTDELERLRSITDDAGFFPEWIAEATT